MEPYELTDREFEEATEVGQKIYKEGPLALHARYDRREKKIVVELTNGAEIRFSPRIAQGLSEALDYDLSEIIIEGGGLGINFPRINADLYVPALSRFIFGSEQWMASIPEKLLMLEQEKNLHSEQHKNSYSSKIEEIFNIIKSGRSLILSPPHQDVGKRFKCVFNEPEAFINATILGKLDLAGVRLTGEGTDIEQSLDEDIYSKFAIKSKTKWQSKYVPNYAEAKKPNITKNASQISDQTIH